ncbi:MAG: DUF480 domain-containing protein [Xanthomonadales bacterium]|nr:DUF480 domain-containing protein [Xanthomonadales bacterium]
MSDTLDESLTLTPIEARIIGCLIEKASTTPESYPLTVNSLVLAANQKTSREPIMSIEEGEVGHALRELEDRGWVRVVHGSRAHRYEHRIEDKLSVTRPQRALLCLLMLRGPQSAPELLTRSDRLADIGSLDDLKPVLERLQQRGFVANVGRAAGQREDRFAQLFCGPVVVNARADERDNEADAASAGSLSARVAALEHVVAELSARLTALERDGSAHATTQDASLAP